MMEKNKIDCYKCKFFYVTWDRQFPKGCKAFQFKGRMLPSIEVKKSSGQDCLRFQPK
ncbi:uracil-DNA glycosylase [Bacillus sp. B1-b2]|nr:uracil-DNA glycosylase [Bacillus sp. B1-b2]